MILIRFFSSLHINKSHRVFTDVFAAGRAKTQVAGSGSVLTILAAEIPDSGVFLCVANNGVPKAAPAEISQIFYLLVRREFFPYLFLNSYTVKKGSRVSRLQPGCQ